MTEQTRKRPVVLCILDGWGLRAPAPDNAVALAPTPVWDRLRTEFPNGALDASEHWVGLPPGQMGNSEVGHMNIGAGRIVMQDLPRIDAALAAGEIARHPELVRFAERLTATGGAAHLIGLASAGGVHAHLRHMIGLAEALTARGLPVRVHALLDGRDAPPKSAGPFLAELEAGLARLPDAAIATIGGRFFAMDRDQRWERVDAAWRCLALAEGDRAADWRAALAAAYARGETDEFVACAPLGPYAGMRDGDGVVMANFRADRARQILHALLDPGFDAFARPGAPQLAAALGMASYSAALDPLVPALFPPIDLADTLGEVVSKAGRTQLRLAETEKHAHVTFFLNGGEERVFPGEERVVIPSPKVKTYDLAPEMAAAAVTDELIAAIGSGRFDLIVVNYANGDQVGHSGALDAAIAAVACVDRCLGRVLEAVAAAGAALIVTADHGNCEQMWDAAADAPHTQHTLNLVPAILVGGPPEVTALGRGRLADLAPTVLELMGLPQPAAMTGRSLLIRRPALARAG